MTGAVWLGHEGVRWNIMLAARLDDAPSPDGLRERLAALASAQGWRVPAPDAVREGEDAELLQQFDAYAGADHVSVGRTPQGVVVRAHHAAVDGLGLLAVLRELTGTPVTSSAVGVTERPHRSALSTIGGRLAEVAFRPPAAFPGRRHSPGSEDDVLVQRTLDRPVRTADLVHAAAAAIGRPRVAVAIGVSTLGGAAPEIGERSGFLRLTGVDRMEVGEVETALRVAPLQLGGTAPTALTRRAAGLIRWASRRFSGRLGSTVLVSHLGRVEGAGLRELAFYPLAGTGSGVSVGAATVGTSTTLTLRARGRTHAAEDLEAWLADLVEHLGT